MLFLSFSYRKSTFFPRSPSRTTLLLQKDLLPGTDARPADIHMRRWTKDKDTAFDVTVINPLQIALVDRCAVEPGHALDVAKRRKMDQSWEACRQEGLFFAPLPVETFGSWHNDAAKELRRIAIAAARNRGKDEAIMADNIGSFVSPSYFFEINKAFSFRSLPFSSSR